jgi:hypothetical protein
MIEFNSGHLDQAIWESREAVQANQGCRSFLAPCALKCQPGSLNILNFRQSLGPDEPEFG